MERAAARALAADITALNEMRAVVRAGEFTGPIRPRTPSV